VNHRVILQEPADPFLDTAVREARFKDFVLSEKQEDDAECDSHQGEHVLQSAIFRGRHDEVAPS